MTKPESELTEKQKQMKIRLTSNTWYPTELSNEDKQMIKEKYQGRSAVNHTVSLKVEIYVPHLVCILEKKRA